MKQPRTQTDMFRATQAGRLRAATDADERDRFGHQYAGTTPRQRGSDTSRAAGDAARGPARNMRMEVYAYVLACGDYGATTEEIELALGMRQSTAGARRVELTKSGALKDSGKRRPTTSGAMAGVYVADVAPRGTQGGGA